MDTEAGHTAETRRLLTAADYFLQHRIFDDCCKYAARALDSDPANSAAARILSTAALLSASKISATHHDYYALLNLPYFESDASRIASSFETLTSILDPNANPSPLTSEAFDLAVKAWSILSNSAEKAEFDAELRTYMDAGGCASRTGGGTFWTMCPYCYSVYEYDKVYEDCCLKCANERCRRVLHAVAIRVPPPPDVVAKGQYCCPGFMPFDVHSSSNGEKKLWVPFAPSLDVGKELDLNSSTFEDAGGRVRMKRKKSVPWKSRKLLGSGISINGDEAHLVYGVREESYSNVDKQEGEPCSEQVEFLEGDDDIFISF
ncbi:hypothetical protein AAHA92_02375 [Salvia divinorum]|uniref:J domain-containing protein n=1 Tax=Salvia divinorum TaxID=28513 RepID=A0ABD1IGE6_SALDI